VKKRFRTGAGPVKFSGLSCALRGPVSNAASLNDLE
jgi:hypothetical protein